MAESMKNHVRRVLLDLIVPLGYRISQSTGDEHVVVLESLNLRLRVIRDRGQFFADLADLEGLVPWCDTAFVRQWLEGRAASLPTQDGDSFLGQLAAFIQRHDEQLQREFSPYASPRDSRRVGRNQA